jgi:hypothetical protein
MAEISFFKLDYNMKDDPDYFEGIFDDISIVTSESGGLLGEESFEQTFSHASISLNIESEWSLENANSYYSLPLSDPSIATHSDVYRRPGEVSIIFAESIISRHDSLVIFLFYI